MKEKIIITGGAGFIGSALVWGLNKLGIDNILIVDNLNKEEKEKNISPLEFSDCIGKKKFLEKMLQGVFNKENIDCIFHLGACTSTTERNLDYLLENNYRYSQKLAIFAFKKNIRFIYASSAATYGDGSQGFSDDEDLLPYLKPLNLYGYSKHWFDLWAKKNSLLERSVGLKYFNVYGPNEYHKGEMRSFVIKAYEQIMKDGQVRLFKSYRSDYRDGEQKRDFIYVKDVVNMTLFFWQKRSLAGIYNIGTGAPHSFNELVKASFEALAKNTNIEYVDMPDNLKSQYQYYTSADITKLRKAGYKDNFWEFPLAIKDYILNYLKSNSHLSLS